MLRCVPLRSIWNVGPKSRVRDAIRVQTIARIGFSDSLVSVGVLLLVSSEGPVVNDHPTVNDSHSLRVAVHKFYPLGTILTCLLMCASDGPKRVDLSVNC